MSFISLWYLLFIALVAILYFVIPKKWRWIVLLVASYVFYLINDLRSVIFLIFTTGTVYFATYRMNKLTEEQNEFFAQQSEDWLKENKKEYQKKTKKKKKIWLVLTLLINFSILFVLKYFSYLADAFANLIHVEPLGLNILLPLGISFYMFQSLGYVIDVYFDKVKPEKNIFKVALFTSFFPQLIQGPISRFSQLAPQLYEGNDFSFKNIKSGVLTMVWGYFKKMVIADRANILFSAIMNNYTVFQGPEIFVGMLCFVLKLYCDFSGGIDIARGSAQLLGIEMTPNFNRPFFALSVTEYWRRWHITLGAWMKDYVLYPLTLSKGYNKFIRWCRKVFKKGVAGKVIPSGIAMFFVFLIVGIWHGPNLTYLLFGVYNGIIILIETIINETRKLKKVQPKERSKHMQRFITFLKFSLTFMLVFFGKYFSALPDIQTVFACFVATFKISSFKSLFSDFLYRTDFSDTNLVLLLVSTIFLIFIEVLQEKNVNIKEWIFQKKAIVQIIIFFVAIFLVVLFATYSSSGGGFAYENF